MSYIDKELAQAINNLNRVSKTAVPKATSQSLNRVSKRIISRSVKDTANELKVTQKLVRTRVKHVKATARKPVSYIKLHRGKIPAIAIGAARTQVVRKRGQNLVSAVQRDKRGRYSQRQYSGNTSIKVGRYTFKNAFLQKLSNGRWHIMQRTNDPRYPIEVVALPLVKPITTAFQTHSQRLLASDMPKELKANLNNQLRLILKRRS